MARFLAERLVEVASVSSMGARQGAKQKRAVNVRERQAAVLWIVTLRQLHAKIGELTLGNDPVEVAQTAASKCPIPKKSRWQSAAFLKL